MNQSTDVAHVCTRISGVHAEIVKTTLYLRAWLTNKTLLIIGVRATVKPIQKQNRVIVVRVRNVDLRM